MTAEDRGDLPVTELNSTIMTDWELAAREQIRHTITAYAVAGDSGRVKELAAQFTEDGVLEIRGRDSARGRAGITEMLTRHADAGRPADGGPFFVRHFVTNILVTDLAPAEAHAIAYFTVFTADGPDHWGRYRDHLVPVGDRWLLRHRTVRVDSSVDAGWYRRVHGTHMR